MITEAEKQLWLDALRSGKFTQINHYLHNGRLGCYCALGLGLKAALGIEDRQMKFRASFSYPFTGVQQLIDDEELKQKLVYWLSDTYIDQITKMNDISKHDFLEIADWIELEVVTVN